VIYANPPFSKNQDIDHAYKMFESLSDNGVMVAVLSYHWVTSKNKKETLFREWLNEKNAYIEELPPGMFSDSGTNIPTVLIKIKKR
jgi:nitrogen regulatory protein PII-like uncharacterized protein